MNIKYKRKKLAEYIGHGIEKISNIWFRIIGLKYALLSFLYLFFA